MSDWNKNQPNVSYTFTTSYDTYPTTYTVLADGFAFSILPDLDAIYTKADKEFDAMEDQTSVARQMLNDIGINWNEE